MDPDQDPEQTDIPDSLLAAPVCLVMSRELCCVGADAPATVVVDLLLGTESDALAVVDPLRRPLGLVTRSDILGRLGRVAESPADPFRVPQPATAHERHLLQTRAHRLGPCQAADLMTPVPLLLTELTSLGAAAEEMALATLHHAVVVSSVTRSVLGVLSSLDMVRWVNGEQR